MARPTPISQDRKVQLNASIILRLKERLEEEHDLSGQSVSEIVEEILMKHYGMERSVS